MSFRRVYVCPVHGLIESPRFFGPPYADSSEEEAIVCPINLSSNERGITDELCDEVCVGPVVLIALRGSRPEGLLENEIPPLALTVALSWIAARWWSRRGQR